MGVIKSEVSRHFLPVACILGIVWILAYVALYSIPYYSYVDEGHVLLWVDSVYKGDAPLRIFYGPVIFYFILCIDLLMQVFKQGVGYLPEYIFSDFDSLFYNHYKSETLIYSGRMVSLAFLSLSLGLAYSISLFKTKSVKLSIAVLVFFALQPFFYKFSVISQPEIISSAFLLLAVLYLYKKKEEEMFRFGSIVFLSFVFALLAATKIHYLAFCLLPVVVLYMGSGFIKAFKYSLIFVPFTVIFVVLLYYPYRSPEELYEMVIFASKYYAEKPAGIPLGSKLMGSLSIYQMIVILAIPLWLFRGKVSHVASGFIYISIIMFLYFSTKPFSNDSNFFFLNILVLILVLEMIGDENFRVVKRIGMLFLLASMIPLGFSFSKWVGANTSYVDNRSKEAVLDALTSESNTYVDPRLQIYPKSDWVNLRFLSTKGPGDELPLQGSGYYVVAEKYDSLDACELRESISGVEASRVNFYARNNLAIFIYYCGG